MSCQCGGMIEIVDIFMFPMKNLVCKGLTHCGTVMPYGIDGIGPHCLSLLHPMLTYCQLKHWE